MAENTLAYDLANSTTPTGVSENLPTPSPGQLSADDIALAAQRNLDPSPPSAKAGPSAQSLLAAEAQRRLGLGFTPDLSDPQMRDAIGKAMKLHEGGQLDSVVQGNTTPSPETPTETPVNSPAEASAASIKARDAHEKATAEDIDAIVKNKIDTNGSYDPSSTANPAVSFDVGQQIGMNNWKDAETVLKRWYPQGEIYNLGGYPFRGDTDLYIYREAPDQPFKPLGAMGKVGEMTNYRNAGNLAALGISPSKGIFKTAGLTGMSTALGDYIDHLDNRFRGLSQDIGLVDATMRASQSGLKASIPMYVLGGVFHGIPAALSLGNKAQSLAVTKLGRLVQPTMQDLSDRAVGAGLDPLTLGQVGPEFVQKIARQTGAISGRMKAVTFEQLNSVRQALERAVGSNPDLATNPVALRKMVDAERDQLLAELPVAKGIGQSPTGMNLASGLEAWRNNAKVMVRSLGANAAEKAGDTWVGMPTAPLKQAAARVKIGVKAPGEIDPETGLAPTVQLEPPTQKIAPILKKIEKLGERLGTITDEEGNVHNAFDQFIALRDELYDLKYDPNGTTRRQAHTLWDATMRMAEEAGSEISGKQGTRYSESFRNSYKGFIDTYKDTQDTLDLFQGMLQARDPGNLATPLIRPGKLKTIQNIKKALVGTPNQPAWDEIVNGFRSNLQEDLVKGGKRIRELQVRDPAVLDEVMSKGEQESWLELADAEAVARKSVSAGLAEKTGSNLENAIHLAQKASKEEIAKYAAANGGVNGGFAQSIRTGIWSDILNAAKSIDEKTGEESINPHALNEAIRKYMIGTRRDALEPVMTQADWDTMALLRRYSAVVGADVASVGDSLQSASISSHLWDVHGLVTNKARFALSILKMMNARVMSNVLATPVSESLFTRSLNADNMPSALKLFSHGVSFATEKRLHAARQEPADFK